MQELAWVIRFCVQNPKFTQVYPQMKIVQDFGSELTKNTPAPEMK